MTSFPPETVAFITGAASGIGLAVAQQLLLDGVTKLALVDISNDALITAGHSLEALSSTVKLSLIAADCSSEEQVNEAVERTVKELGRVDVVFNGAGIAGNPGKIAEQEVSNLDRVLGLNLRGVWLVEKAVIAQMMKQGERPVSTGLPVKARGSIVNAGSIASHLAIESLSPYIMSKHGVLGLTKTDARDYATSNIRVNAVCPGWIHTTMTQQLYDSEIGETLISRAPMKRWALPQEVAHVVCFLLSDKASFVTGASISVDGGYTAC